MEVRAMENRVFCVTANRYGEEQREPRPRLAFTGASQVVSPAGKVLTAAEPEGDELLQVEVDVSKARTKQIASGNDVIRDRRPEWYHDVVSRKAGETA